MLYLLFVLKAMDYTQIILESLDEAGEILLSYFNKNLKITKKLDKTPVSEADLAVNQFLCKKLTKLGISIVSEENSLLENKIIARKSEFWLLDPLDGTKAFLRKEKNFAICLAQIIDGRAKFGFIHIPFTKETYYNNVEGAFVRNANGANIPIYTKKQDNNLHILASNRMRGNKMFLDYIKRQDVKQISMISSAIKFCHIAVGKSQLFPYFADTMQWDVAAGDAIIHAAGGMVVDMKGQKLQYGGFNSFKNPYFIVNA